MQYRVLRNKKLRFHSAFSSAILISTVALSSLAEGRTFSQIKETKEIRACFIHSDFLTHISPAGCKKDCTIASPHFELATLFAERLSKELGTKIKLTQVIQESAEAFFHNDAGVLEKNAAYTPRLLKTGECDFYAESIVKNEWRSNKAEIVAAIPSRMLILVNEKDAAKFTNEDSLAGKIGIVDKGTIYETWIQEKNKDKFKASPVKIVHTKGAEDKIASVSEKKADFTIFAVSGGLRAATTLGAKFANVRPAFTAGPITYAGWGLRKEDKELTDFVHKFFEQQTKEENSELSQIWKKYMGKSFHEFVSLISATHN